MKGVLSCLLALVLTLSITPSVFAESVGGKAWIGEKEYPTLEDAVKAAASGDTITLGEGTYSLFQKTLGVTGKKLTFDGKGTDKTTWIIGANPPDPSYFGTQYNGDACFNGADTVIFKNMKLISGNVDYLGFQHTDNTVVENCVINGKTFYWGYQTAIFKNTIFNCPSGDYAIWTYSSPVMTFDNCTFNSSGKVINVYTDYSAGSHDITVNFNGCTVNNSIQSLKPVLNINDSNMGNFKYVINISGDNVVNGVDTDKTTCSRLFGYGGKADKNNTGKTIVSFGNTTVWTPVRRQNGKMGGEMVDNIAYHNNGVTADGVTYTNDVEGSNKSLYAEGYKDNVFTTTTTGEWTTNADGKITRTVTKTCKYCGYEEEVTEYRVTYYYSNGTAKPTDSPKTGDNSSLALWFALLLANGGAVTATTIYGRENKRSVK